MDVTAGRLLRRRNEGRESLSRRTRFTKDCLFCEDQLGWGFGGIISCGKLCGTRKVLACGAHLRDRGINIILPTGLKQGVESRRIIGCHF